MAAALHDASHHGDREDRILKFAALNAFHVGLIRYFLERLNNTADGDGTLLDRAADLRVADGRLEPSQPQTCAIFIAGRADGALNGGLHLAAPGGTPLANVMLGVLRALGGQDLERFGDSEAAFDLNTSSPGRVQ
ncbi:MAG: hypothetical protein ACRD2I_23860 [Vicinamibacterales bacterium]